MKKPRKTETKKYVKPEIVKLTDTTNSHGVCLAVGSMAAGLLGTNQCVTGFLPQ